MFKCMLLKRELIFLTEPQRRSEFWKGAADTVEVQSMEIKVYEEQSLTQRYL